MKEVGVHGTLHSSSLCSCRPHVGSGRRREVELAAVSGSEFCLISVIDMTLCSRSD